MTRPARLCLACFRPTSHRLEIPCVGRPPGTFCFPCCVECAQLPSVQADLAEIARGALALEDLLEVRRRVERRRP